MTLPALASVADLEARLGKSIPTTSDDGNNQARAASLLSDASTLVRHEARATWVDAEGDLTDVPDLAVTITIAAALRAWFNPAAIESAQLGAVSVRYSDVWLTAREAERLNAINGSGGIQSIDLEHGYGISGDPRAGWVPYDFTGLGAAAGDLFPLGY